MRASSAVLRSLILIRDVADDLPAAVRLSSEHVHARLFRNCFIAIARRDCESPNKPHDRDLAYEQDFLDGERIGVTLALVAERALQGGADVGKAALGKSALVVAQVGRKDRAHLVFVAGVEILRLLGQRGADFGRRVGRLCAGRGRQTGKQQRLAAEFQHRVVLKMFRAACLAYAGANFATGKPRANGFAYGLVRRVCTPPAARN
jgi:hypothetical protein